MNLKDQLFQDLKVAMKAGDKTRLGVIRLLRAKIGEMEIAKKRDLTDDELLSVLTSAVKQRKESISQYEQGNRQDLVEKEQAELEIIQKYLPEQLSEDKVKSIIADAIAETGAQSMQDLGQVMKIVMGRVKGQADGKMVNQLVRESLQG